LAKYKEEHDRVTRITSQLSADDLVGYAYSPCGVCEPAGLHLTLYTEFPIWTTLQGTAADGHGRAARGGDGVAAAAGAQAAAGHAHEPGHRAPARHQGTQPRRVPRRGGRHCTPGTRTHTVVNVHARCGASADCCRANILCPCPLQTPATVLAILNDPSKGTTDDKLRLFLVYLLSMQEIPAADLAAMETALQTAGCNLAAVDFAKRHADVRGRVACAVTID